MPWKGPESNTFFMMKDMSQSQRVLVQVHDRDLPHVVNMRPVYCRENG